MATRKKVVPLKTTQQLKVDLELLTEELTQARASNTRLCQEQKVLMDRVANQSGRVATLFTDIRNVARAGTTMGKLPWSTRFMTIVFPKFMLQQAARAATSQVWMQIVQRLNDYTYETYHATEDPTVSKAKATTIHIEKGA